MGVTLDNLKEARLKLEGIGLLKTYYHEGEVNSYVYELYSPVSATEFFSHPIFHFEQYIKYVTNIQLMRNSGIEDVRDRF